MFESNEAFHHSKEVDVSLHTGNEGWWGLLLDGSGVSREAPAPFCEGLGVQFPRSTHRYSNLPIQPGVWAPSAGVIILCPIWTI